MKTLLCFIDVETTGVDHNINGLTQIAGTLAELTTDRKINPLEAFNFDVKPYEGCTIEDEALRVTGKTRELLNGYADEREAYIRLTTLLSKYVDKYDRNSKFWFVAYNAPFDNGFIRKLFDRYDNFDRINRMHEKRRFDEAVRVLSFFGLSFSFQTLAWKNERGARYAVVTPMDKVPEAIVRQHVRSADNYRDFTKGFRNHVLKAYCFNALTAFWPFVESLKQLKEPVQLTMEVK